MRCLNELNTYNNCDLSVGSDERGCCKSDKEEFGEHFEDGWGGLKRTKINILKD
jgi:hypothetical protein